MKNIIRLLLTFLVSHHVSYSEDLDPIVVTATRTPQTVDETLSSVTVLTREDIEKEQARSVPDLLRGLPGITFSNNGGRGQVTSLFLRGIKPTPNEATIKESFLI